jgi:hypothetical protein
LHRLRGHDGRVIAEGLRERGSDALKEIGVLKGIGVLRGIEDQKAIGVLKEIAHATVIVVRMLLRGRERADLKAGRAKGHGERIRHARLAAWSSGSINSSGG